jgi:hypothetical protein
VAWYLNPALTAFRNAVDVAYPNRDKASDGTIGNEAHQATVSDHNPDIDGSVDAWDMDVELNGRNRPFSVDVEYLKTVFQSHESAQYWIHAGQIASRSWGWARRAYTGPNPHDGHVHWNTRSSHENSAQSWKVAMPLTAEDIESVSYRTVTRNVSPSGQPPLSLANTLWDIRNKIDQVLVSSVATADEDLIRRIVREELDRTRLGM